MSVCLKVRNIKDLLFFFVHEVQEILFGYFYLIFQLYTVNAVCQLAGDDFYSLQACKISPLSCEKPASRKLMNSAYCC